MTSHIQPRSVLPIVQLADGNRAAWITWSIDDLPIAHSGVIAEHRDDCVRALSADGCFWEIPNDHRVYPLPLRPHNIPQGPR